MLKQLTEAHPDPNEKLTTTSRLPVSTELLVTTTSRLPVSTELLVTTTSRLPVSTGYE